MQTMLKGSAVEEMCCPKCGEKQKKASDCRYCGIIISKYIDRGRHERKSSVRSRSFHESGVPYPLIKLLLQFLLLFSLVLLAMSLWNKDQLPPVEFYDLNQLQSPRQTKTDMDPFQVEANDIAYSIHPEYDYTLHGVVVSYHESDAWWDIYHRGSWQDFLNIKDLCVIWGPNVSSGVYHDMQFSNTTWTCFASWPDRNVGSRFSMTNLSNNHLLASDSAINEVIMSVEVGDHIAMKGVLASYSHGDSQFTRGTSIVRTDTGNGACETIFVEDFEILSKANEGWRLIYSLSKGGVILALLGLVLILFLAPVNIRIR